MSEARVKALELALRFNEQTTSKSTAAGIAADAELFYEFIVK